MFSGGLEVWSNLFLNSALPHHKCSRCNRASINVKQWVVGVWDENILPGSVTAGLLCPQALKNKLFPPAPYIRPHQTSCNILKETAVYDLVCINLYIQRRNIKIQELSLTLGGGECSMIQMFSYVWTAVENLLLKPFEIQSEMLGLLSVRLPCVSNSQNTARDHHLPPTPFFAALEKILFLSNNLAY